MFKKEKHIIEQCKSYMKIRSSHKLVLKVVNFKKLNMLFDNYFNVYYVLYD